MDDSILITIKTLLDIDEDDDSFDTDVITHINSTLADLTQLGVGPADGFEITDETPVWRDLTNSVKLFNMVKTYIHLSVKLVFDPPQQSSVIAAMEKRIEKLEWRISVAVDTVNATTT